MLALGKALFGATVAVIPASIGTVVATTTHFLKSNNQEEKGTSSTQVESPKDCYSITVTSANEGESFLVCNNSEFYFHTKGQTSSYKKIKSLKVQNPNNIFIVLEENNVTKKLTGNDEEWKDLTKDTEFFNQQKRSCVVANANGSWSSSSREKVLSCTENQPFKAFNTIKLTLFSL